MTNNEIVKKVVAEIIGTCRQSETSYGLIDISYEHFSEVVTTTLTAALEERDREVVVGMEGKIKRESENFFTTQGFVDSVCKACGDIFVWHNGAPPPICKKCSELIEMDAFNKGIYTAISIITSKTK